MLQLELTMTDPVKEINRHRTQTRYARWHRSGRTVVLCSTMTGKEKPVGYLPATNRHLVEIGRGWVAKGGDS